jgi:putative long chain acyl-CoA synthase
MIPFGLPEELTMSAMSFLADRVLARTYLPAWASRTGFRMLDPAKSVRQRIDFVRQLHDRDALLPRERQRRFLQNDGWVAWPARHWPS